MKKLFIAALAAVLSAGLSACAETKITDQGDGLVSVTMTQPGPLWDRVVETQFACTTVCGLTVKKEEKR